jgi:hypothetical protein
MEAHLPKIFEYLGIILFFWSNEHEPIHVHGEYQGHQSKAEIVIENGKVTRITIKKVPGRKPLEDAQLSDFEAFVEAMGLKIADKWVDYFVYHRKLTCERITKKVK